MFQNTTKLSVLHRLVEPSTDSRLLTRTALTGHSWIAQRTAGLSPICEFGILAARARSKENAAIAKSSVPPRGGKTGHSCKAQQDKSVELTDCGQNGPWKSFGKLSDPHKI
jgi:hypothetical protein